MLLQRPLSLPLQLKVQSQRREEEGGRQNFFPRHPRSDDRALRSDGGANATAAAAALPEVASIINGKLTGGPLPYMVGLTGIELCGGTLISPTIVMTAAHCMYHPPGNWNPVDKVLVNWYDQLRPN